MLTLKEQAQVCRIGLVIGLLLQADVARWADGIIESDDSPDSALIDISLMGSSNLPTLLTALYDVQGDADSGRVVNAVLGICAVRLLRGSLTADEAAVVLDALVPDMSCRRCNIRAEYTAPVDPKTAAAIRAALTENAAAKFLAPYAAYATDITLKEPDYEQTD